MSQALNAVVNCLPGTRDVNQAIIAIATASQALQSKQVYFMFFYIAVNIHDIISIRIVREKPTKCYRII